METDLLEDARLELAPELAVPPDPGIAPVQTRLPGMTMTEEELDVAMYERLQRAKQPSTEPGFTRNGITMTAEEIGAVSLAAEKDALRSYKERRIARGEQPFQYLPGAKTKQENAAFREQLPFFATMFAGPDKFAEAFPADQRQAVEDRFADSFQPAAEKMTTANKLFFETMTGQEVDDELWPAQRSAFARERLGYQGASLMIAGGDPSIATAVVDDATFYQLARSKITEQQTEVETTRKVAELTRAHAIRGQSLGDAIAAAKEAAGPDWKKYESAAREGYAGVLADFDNRTITAANKLFDFAAKAEGMVSSDLKFEDGQAGAMAAYSMADQATRDQMMAIVGTRAEAEGTTVENYFARLAGGVAGGTNSFARALASGTHRREAEDIRKLLAGGKLPTTSTDARSASGILTQLAQFPEDDKFNATETRPLTPEERKEWEARAIMLEGYSTFLTDTETAGIKVRRYLDNKREGFWDTLADTTVMMAESLPVMAAAMVPYGGGIVLAANGYAEKNLSSLRREAPDADPETLKAAAFTSGFIEAGIDRLQILTLGARMPKLNAALLKYGKPGLAGVIAVQSVTKGTAEFAQEIAQDLTLPQIQEFASALAEDIPGPDWEAVLQREQEALGDIARVSFGFGIIGGAGSSITNYMEAGKIRETLQDRAGLELAGIDPVTVTQIADLAETNPAAAAETLKAAIIETPVETRAANSQAAVAKQEAEALMTTGNQDAGLPVLSKLDDGRVEISYPDRAAEIVAGPEEALEAVRGWEQEADVSVTQANREMLGYLEDYHRSSPDTAFKGLQTGKKVSLADWAGESRERTAQAQARVQIMLRQAGQDMGGIDLSQVPILGSSQNQSARGITSIVAKINDGGNPLTVIEEHAEGVAKWLMDTAKVPEAKMIGWLRETEQKLGKPLLSDNILTLDPAARQQEIVEAWSYLAQANAAGRVADSALPRGVKAFFRAFKEFINTALRIIADFTRLRGEGALDPEMTYWLDVAAGINEEFETENLNREMEAELEREAMDGMPEIRDTLAGVLPNPETPGVLFRGELRAIYDGMKNDPANGASPAARTRKANEFFLPFGETADLDEIRENANEKGFNFATPAEMLEALDLSVNFGKPQYGMSAGMDTEASFAISLPTDPLLTEIANRIQLPEKNAEVFQKMRDRVREVKARFETLRLSAEFNSDQRFDKVRFEQARDLAVLEAVAKSLPPELRGKLTGSFRKISELRTTKARGEYIQSLIPKIETALEKHIAGQFRSAIRREMDRGAIKVSEARTRGGKIGAAGHAIFEQARKAMTFTQGEADVIAEKLTAQIEASGEMTLERLEELDGMRAATELFADYENADSVRLEEALQLLKGVYAEGRKEWLDVLMARRDLREQRVRQLRAGLGLVTVDDAGGQTPTYISRPDRSRAKRKGEKTPNAASEAIMAAMLSGSQTLRRLGELSEDPTVATLVEEIEQAFATAENVEADRNAADNIALAAALRDILGVSTEYGLAKRLRELSDGSKDAPVDTVEGFKEEDVKVPKAIIESILRREVSGFTDPKGNRIDLDETDLAALEKAWDQFQELDDPKQAARRTVTFLRRTAKGSRVGLGPVSMLEGLQLWLTMRQPDQATKLEAMGYDSTTLSQLETWLPADVQALGLWMVDHIGKDAFAVDNLHRLEKGVGLAMVENNYFPVRNNVSRSDNTGAALDGQPPQQSGRNVSFIKERVVNRAEPALVNALAVFLAHRAQSNFWMSHVTAIREWGGVLKDESMADAIRVRMGEKYYQSLQQLMKRIESGGSLAAGQVNDFERVIKRMMKSFALGTLGLRVSTLMVNTTAALNAAFEIPAGTLLRGMMEVSKRPAAFRDAWNSPAIQRRIRDGASFEAALAKSSGPSKQPILALLDSIAEKGVAPINYIDTGANLIAAAAVWEHTRLEATRAGLDTDAAKAAADRKVEIVLRRTAQPTGRLARSEIEQRALDNPLSALFALFISEPRKNFALTYLAARELLTGKGTYGKQQAAQQLAMGLIVYAAGEYIVRSFFAAWAGAKDDEEDGVWERFKVRMTDPKAWGHKLSTGHLTGVPVFGQGWNAAMSLAFDQPVFDSSPNPLFKSVAAIDKIGTAFGKDDEEGNDPEAGDRFDAAVKAAQGLGSVLPGGALFAQLGNVADFGEGIIETDVEKLARYKARFRKFEKDLPKAGDDKAIQQQNRRLRADWLKGELAPLTPERRKQVLDTMDPPEVLRNLLTN